MVNSVMVFAAQDMPLVDPFWISLMSTLLSKLLFSKSLEML